MVRLGDLALNISEEEYRKIDAISYSVMSSFMKRGPKSLIYDDVKNTKYLTFGHIVDCLLLTPEDFDKLFYVSNSRNEPSDAIKTVMTDIFSHGIHDLSKSDNIASFFRRNGIYNTYKDETIVKKAIDEGSEYLESLVKSNNRFIISQKDYNDGYECAEILKYNPFTNKYFGDISLEKKLDGYEVLRQPKFLKSIGLNDIKCMCDMIHVDHKAKTIQIIDLKTMADKEIIFVKSYNNWRYDIQSSFYSFVISRIIRNTELSDYKILPFKFICINRDNRKPLIYSDNLFDKIMRDEDLYYKGKPYKNFFQIMHEINWHRANNEFDYSVEAISNNGEFILDEIKPNI